MEGGGSITETGWPGAVVGAWPLPSSPSFFPFPPAPVWFSPFTASRLGRLLPEPQSLPGSRSCRRDTRIDGVIAVAPAMAVAPVAPAVALPVARPPWASGSFRERVAHPSEPPACHSLEMSYRKASPRISQCFLPAVAQSQGDNPVASSRDESRGRGVRVPHPSCPGPVLQVCEE